MTGRIGILPHEPTGYNERARPCRDVWKTRAKPRLRPGGKAWPEEGKHDQRSVSRVTTVSLEPTIHEIPRSLEPASQSLLLTAGACGFLVCRRHYVTLPQAEP